MAVGVAAGDDAVAAGVRGSHEADVPRGQEIQL